MKEHGILFSPPMVRALLAGRKTETRRIAKGKPPRWAVGDRLWVRESFWLRKDAMIGWKDPNAIVYLEEPMDEERLYKHRKVPGIHMPRWASRITLDVTAVRTEPLQRMTVADAINEGSCVRHDFTSHSTLTAPAFQTLLTDPLECFKAAWADINGPCSWDSNPDVHVIQFPPFPSFQGGKV